MNRIKQLREENSWTQLELAKKLNCAMSSIAMYENGDRKPSLEVLIKLSETFDCSIDYLLGKSSARHFEVYAEDWNNPNLVTIPVIGKIAAGKPLLAQEDIESTLPIDLSMYGLSTAKDLFYLLVSGQSMNMKVKNGDYALIHKQDYAEDGDIVVAIVNGDNEATLKRYKKLNDQFVLLEPMSTDPTIEAITVDLKNTNFQIIGKAIGQFGKF